MSQLHLKSFPPGDKIYLWAHSCPTLSSKWYETFVVTLQASDSCKQTSSCSIQLWWLRKIFAAFSFNFILPRFFRSISKRILRQKTATRLRYIRDVPIPDIYFKCQNDEGNITYFNIIMCKMLFCYKCESQFIGTKRRRRQGQSDLYSDCVDERPFHFGRLDNGDFSLLESMSFGFRLYQGNLFYIAMWKRW